MKLVVALSTILAFVVPSSRFDPADLRRPQTEVRYYLVDGPDYRGVPRATFESYASACRPKVVRRYSDLRVVTHLCYL